MLTASRIPSFERIEEADPRGVGWIGLSVIGVGAVLVGYALRAAVWFSAAQPSAPEKLDMFAYDFPSSGRLESDYTNGGAWVALLMAITISVFACFRHRNRVLTAVASIAGGLLAAGFTALFLHDIVTDYSSRYFDQASLLSAGPFLAMGGYLLVGLGGVIGAIEVRHAEPWQ